VLEMFAVGRTAERDTGTGPPGRICRPARRVHAQSSGTPVRRARRAHRTSSGRAGRGGRPPAGRTAMDTARPRGHADVRQRPEPPEPAVRRDRDAGPPAARRRWTPAGVRDRKSAWLRDCDRGPPGCATPNAAPPGCATPNATPPGSATPNATPPGSATPKRSPARLRDPERSSAGQRNPDGAPPDWGSPTQPAARERPRNPQPSLTVSRSCARGGGSSPGATARRSASRSRPIPSMRASSAWRFSASAFASF
jgi:hypothetical protein